MWTKVAGSPISESSDKGILLLTCSFPSLSPAWLSGRVQSRNAIEWLSSPQGSRKVGHLKTTWGSSIFSCCGSYSYSLLFNHVVLLSLFFPCYLCPFLSDSHRPDFFWPCSSLCLVWVGLFWVLKQNSWALSRGPTSQLLCLVISGGVCSKSILIAISHPSRVW